MTDFDALTARLVSENIPYTIDDTGGGCMVLFVRFADSSAVTLTPSEEPNDDPRNHWLMCFDQVAEHLWTGDSKVISHCATTDGVIWRIRQYEALKGF